MNRRDARKIAEVITNEQIQEMFNNAKSNISDWAKVSNVNKGITKGTAWNILAKNFDITINHHILAKTNFVREFGDFLPEELNLNQNKSKIKQIIIPVHQDPMF